jgi:hypothetical protein
MAERDISRADTTRGSERGASSSTPARPARASAAATQETAGARDSPTLGRNADSEPRAGGIIERAREQAAAKLAFGKDRALDGLGGVAQAVRETTQSLRNQQHDTIAGYVDEAANQIDRLARHLKNKSVGELIDDTRQLARRQPALFIGAAFAIGLVGARFVKSSSPERDEGDWHGGTR